MKIFYRVSAPVFLVIAIIAAYAPFLNLRVLRMAGDEKVYISQAIEMARGGRWFVQTLADEPNYFKPPLHYILIRLGMLAFGDQLIAGTWMNLFFALIAGLAMYWVGRKAWDERAALLLGAAAALNVGVFSHALASQMEVELAGFYALATAALAYSTIKPGSHWFARDVWFWVAAGMAGWVKSPVHSVLLGVSGVTYWAMVGQLKPRIRSLSAWLAVFAGIAACMAIYFPLLFADRKNFVALFLGRENFGKPNNNRSWTYVTTPLLYFAMPWTFVVLGGIFQALRGIAWSGLRSWKANYLPIERNYLKLAVAIVAPSLLMWTFWSYKGQNYNLPTLCGFFLFAWAALRKNIPRSIYRITGITGLLVWILGSYILLKFWPLPHWWSNGWVFLFVAGTLGFAVAFLFSRDARNLVVGSACLFLAFGACVAPLGEREMIGMKRFMKQHPGFTYHYSNLDPSVWSEWGILQLTLHEKFYGLHRPEQISDALEPGHAIIARSPETLDLLKKAWTAKAATHPGLPAPQVTPWSRWLTKGRTSSGESRWKAAWTNRDLSFLELEFYIFWIPAHI